MTNYIITYHQLCHQLYHHRSMTLDPRMLSARARSFSGGHVAAGTPPEGDWRARLRDLLQDSVPVLPRLGRDADLGIHPSDVQE